MKLSFWFFALCGTLFVFCGINAANIGYSSIKPPEIYVYSFSAMPDVAYTPDRIKSKAIRKIIIQEPSLDLCLIEFLNLKNQVYYESTENTPDVRLVFSMPDVEIAFDAKGENGYVNGAKVIFQDNCRKWFKKHLLPLAPVEKK